MGNKNRQSGESVYTDCRYVGIGMGSVGGPHFGPAPNPVWLVLCGRASDGVAVVSHVGKPSLWIK